MWCINCGRKQPQSSEFCAYCGEKKITFSRVKPEKPDSVYARDLHLLSMCYYFMVLAGLLLVLLEIGEVIVYAFNVAALLLQDTVAMSAFYGALVVQEPFHFTFTLSRYIVVGFLGASVVTAGFFTKQRTRQILSFVSGGLMLLWLILSIAGVSILGIDLITGILLMSLVLVAGYVGHSYLNGSAITAIIGIVIAIAVTLFAPTLCDSLVNTLFAKLGYEDFVALCDPFLALVTIAAVAIPHCSALSRMAGFFSQIPDLCHPRRKKKEKKAKAPKQRKYKDIGRTPEQVAADKAREAEEEALAAKKAEKTHPLKIKK